MFASRFQLLTCFPTLVLVLAVVLGAPQGLLAQSTGTQGAGWAPLRLPAPIRFPASHPRENSREDAREQRAALAPHGATQRASVRPAQYQADRRDQDSSRVERETIGVPHHRGDDRDDAGPVAATGMPAHQAGAGASWSAVPSHQIVRAPRIVHPGHDPADIAGQSPVSLHEQHEVPPLIHQRTPQLPPAVIPDASHREVWKSPFSYGYFGATGTRQWVRHYGYRDRDREWRLRW